MIARVIQAVVKQGMLDEVVDLVDSKLGPEFLDREGAMGLILLTHKGTGQAISIGLWASPEDMERDSSAPLEAALAQVLPMLEEAPSTRTFQVSAHLEPELSSAGS